MFKFYRSDNQYITTNYWLSVK